MIKNLPAMQEMRVRFLGWKDPLEKGMQSTPVFLPAEFHGLRGFASYSPWGHKESDVTELLIQQHNEQYKTYIFRKKKPTSQSMLKMRQ